MNKIKKILIRSAVILSCTFLIVKTCSVSDENIQNDLNPIEIINDSLENEYKLCPLTKEEQLSLLLGKYVIRPLSNKSSLVLDLSSFSK